MHPNSLSINGSFQDPWNKIPHWFYRESERVKPGMYDEDEMNEKKTQLSKMAQGKEWAHKNIDAADGKEKEAKKEELVEALASFQNKTGIDESEYIKKIKDCDTMGQIKKLEAKFKKAAKAWYEMQMRKSGAFEPMDDRETTLLDHELNDLSSWFAKLPFSGGEENMVDTLSDLEENLKFKLVFRKKLEKQSSFIKSEFFRRLGSLALVGSREKLLENILKELKDVEEAPSAVQYEFKKLQKKAKAGKDTASVKKEVMDMYENRSKIYKKGILDNLEYFGGDLITTPHGKIPEAAWEFIEWFDEQQSFIDMDNAIKKLPKMVKDRKRLYEKRDKILENVAPAQKKKLIEKTKRMRRHELEDYLPELEKYVKRNGFMVAEYLAILKTSRVYNVDLFQPEEITKMLTRFKLCDMESQKARLLFLEEEAADREQMTREYFALPSHVRNDDRFVTANPYEREQMLLDAKEQINREKKNPLDMSHVENINSNFIQNDLLNRIDSDEGENIIEDVLEEINKEGALKIADTQENTYKKIYGIGKRMENKDQTFKEAYTSDLAKWMRTSEHLAESEQNINSVRDQWKYNALKNAGEMYDMGYVTTSGGEINKLQVISKNELSLGQNNTLEKLSKAKYGEHVMIQNEKGEDELNPLDMIEKMSMPEIVKVLMLAITKLSKNKMHLSDNQMNLIRNSSSIKKELASKIITKEFSHLTMDPANNVDHFINQAAA